MRIFLIICVLFGSFIEAKSSRALQKPRQISHIDNYNRAHFYLQNGEYKEAIECFSQVIANSYGSKLGQESSFYLPVCYFRNAQMGQASNYFTQYLERKGELPHFTEAIEYKFQIAEAYRTGRHRHFLEKKWLPAMMGSKEEAIKIYDEVVAAYSNHELAVQSLYYKGLILASQLEYDAALDVFRSLSHRYPNHALTEQSYLEISHLFLKRSKKESQNPDLLDLAQINLQTLQKAFPTSPLNQIAQDEYRQMREYFAKSLYLTGKFYLRKSKPQAAKIYFNELMAKYPETSIAKDGMFKKSAVS